MNRGSRVLSRARQVMYTRPIPMLLNIFKVNKHFTLEDPEDLDLEWLETRIAGKN